MDLSEQRYLSRCGKSYQLPNMTGGVAILPVSGGADSSYLAILLHQLFPAVDFRMVFTDTGTPDNPVEDPGVYETLDKLEEFLGKKVERLIPEKGLFEIIDQFGGYLPDSRSRYCTRILKKVPFEKWLQQFAGLQKYMFVGIRSDESGRVAFSLDEVETVMPFVDMGLTREDIFAGLQRTIGVPRMYEGRTRSGCTVCPFQRRAEHVYLLQRKPIEFLKGERYEKLSDNDLARWEEAIPLWKDTGSSANWLTLPKPEEGEIEGKRASRAPDLFGARIYVGAEFFMDGFPGMGEFCWHQRVVSVAPTLHHLKDQLDDRYQHLLSTSEVYQMSPDDVRRNARFAIYVIELPSAVFDPEGPKDQAFTWTQGWAYKQLRHIVSWVTRALHAEGERQSANRKVRSELSVLAEWRDNSAETLRQAKEELGAVVNSQWYRANENEREMTEEEELSYLPCPMCSL
ncbi:phosphoadenosine phosphosulfate reductase family protein [Azonexus hydrophilus]|uniref:Phosphoadenosine phosphosulfate reductase family protein n=1 Tax=Azonexus hydrophilus TaxID=418702 RepID=A0ABZ2XNH4_9RHOO